MRATFLTASQRHNMPATPFPLFPDLGQDVLADNSRGDVEASV